MDKYIIIMLCCWATFFQSCTSKGIDKEAVNLILDTDLGMGFDDVGSLAMLHALADSGYLDILGMVTSNSYELSIPCIEIINSYFGRPDITLGRVNEGISASPKHVVKWTEELVRKYNHTINKKQEVPGAIKTYRKILSEAGDKSLTICSIGFLTNLKDLLLSGADEFSDLSGEELIRQKVTRLVAMGGSFPKGREFNFFRDAEAAMLVVRNWPTEIVFSGSEIGTEVISGVGLSEMKIENSPVKDAYDICMEQPDHFTGMSWDQTAVLVAVKGYEPYYTVERGTCIVAADGSNTWEESASGRHLRLIPRMAPEEVAEIIDRYMEHLPLK